jgi:AAA+ superfamily predicted ATPase
MAGLETVKQRIGKLVDQASINYRLEIDGKKPAWTPLNAVFLGNPGTGKTTVAKIYGRILKCLGLLTDGTCELKRPVDFIGSYVGETVKKTSQLIRTCKGRVLIVDEAHGFHGSSCGKEAMDALIRLVHNAPGEDIAVIFVGGRNDMETMFRAHHPGLARCFSLPTAFVFEDFDDMDLEEIALHALQKTGDITAPLDVVLALVKSVTVQRLAPTFGNAGTMIAAVQQALQRMSARDPCAMELTMSDVTGDQAVPTDPLECLSTLCKTDHLVQELRLLQAGMEQQRRDGVDTRGSLKNYLFLGSAGTGKTTAARTMATILHAWGLLHRNVVVTRTAQDLHGSNLGQTKDKVNAAMAEASGGVLFIDEASDLFGETPDAVDQLIARMTEPEHSGRTVVILAGYKQAMDEMIRHCSGGFCSHFTGRIEFPNWDADDCLRYIRDICQQERRPLEANAETLLYDAFRVAGTHPSWSNARDCVTMQKLLYRAFAARNVQGCVTTNS